jgi:hypothetical protein
MAPGSMFSDLEIDRLVRGIPATDEPPFDRGRDVIEAHIRALYDELAEIDGIELHVERDGYGCGDASFIEAFAWPSGGRTIRRQQQSLAATLRSGAFELIDGMTILISRFGPYAFVAPRTLPRTGGAHFDFAMINLFATAEWIRQLPGEGLAPFATSLYAYLDALGVHVCDPEALLVPLAFQEPLDGSGSLLNSGPNRVFDALFRWCD